MSGGAFGSIVAQVLAGLMVAGVATGAEPGKGAAGAPAAGTGGAKSMKCVHNCSGYGECKGNGNNACKGQNSCANHGLVPKACSSVKTQEACQKVVDAKKSPMCVWQEV